MPRPPVRRPVGSGGVAPGGRRAGGELGGHPDGRAQGVPAGRRSGPARSDRVSGSFSRPKDDASRPRRRSGPSGNETTAAAIVAELVELTLRVAGGAGAGRSGGVAVEGMGIESNASVRSVGPGADLRLGGRRGRPKCDAGGGRTAGRRPADRATDGRAGTTPALAGAGRDARGLLGWAGVGRVRLPLASLCPTGDDDSGSGSDVDSFTSPRRTVVFDANQIEYAFAYFLEKPLGERGHIHDADVFRSGKYKDLGELLEAVAQHFRMRIAHLQFAPEEAQGGGAKARLGVTIDGLAKIGAELKKSARDRNARIFTGKSSVISSAVWQRCWITSRAEAPPIHPRRRGPSPGLETRESAAWNGPM